MTFELISTETAIVDTDKHSVYPRAFIKNRKYRPTAKNIHDGIVLSFNICFWLFVGRFSLATQAINSGEFSRVLGNHPVGPLGKPISMFWEQ